MLDGGQYRMWFTGFQKTFPYAGRIGYATAPVTGIGDQRSDVASEFKLEQNYPNPFNPTTVISYHLPAGQAGLPVVSDVRLVVYDLLGREVAVLVNEKKAPGSYTVQFDAGHFASGTYFYRLQARSLSGAQGGEVTRVGKMMLLK